MRTASVSGNTGKGQLGGLRGDERGLGGFFRGRGLKDQLYRVGPGLKEPVPDEVEVVFQDPVAGELVGAVEDDGPVPFFQVADGIHPEGEGVFGKLGLKPCFDVLPNRIHETYPMDKSAIPSKRRSLIRQPDRSPVG